jgi:hypothetical protein
VRGDVSRYFFFLATLRVFFAALRRRRYGGFAGGLCCGFFFAGFDIDHLPFFFGLCFAWARADAIGPLSFFGVLGSRRSLPAMLASFFDVAI